MSVENKSQQIQAMVLASREQGISYTLFRNAIGKRLGLNTTDFEGLDLIFYRGVATPSELSGYTGLSSGSTTAMIDRLENAGLVERTNNPNDRRGTHVVVTEDARCKIGPLFTSARVAQNDLLETFSPKDLDLLADFFTQSAAMYEAQRQQVLEAMKQVKRT